MQVNNIQQSPACNGRFKKTDALDKAINNAKKRDLVKFEKLLQKMQGVNDTWEYSLKTADSFDADTLLTTRKVLLISNSNNCYSERSVGEEVLRFFGDKKGNCYKNALRNTCDLIKDDYKKAEKEKPINSLKERISRLLFPSSS